MYAYLESVSVELHSLLEETSNILRTQPRSTVFDGYDHHASLFKPLHLHSDGDVSPHTAELDCVTDDVTHYDAHLGGVNRHHYLCVHRVREDEFNLLGQGGYEVLLHAVLQEGEQRSHHGLDGEQPGRDLLESEEFIDDF